MPDKKAFHFEVKELLETGEFAGLASVYNVVDQGGDMVLPGAFTKTIQERGQKVPVLWQHNSSEPVGMGSLEDSPAGLMIRGKLELGLDEAKKSYIRLKSGLVRGLSIGYQTITSAMKDGVRQLKELRLYEVSLVTFPMNELAQVTAVKSVEDREGEFLKALGAWSEFQAQESKAGRRISAATRQRLMAAMKEIQALLEDEDITPSTDGADKSSPQDGAAQQDGAGPGNHAALETKIEELTRLLGDAYGSR